MEAKRLKSQYKSQITTTNNKIKNINKELKKLKQQISRHQNTNIQLENEYKMKENELNRLKLQMDEDNDNEDDDAMDVDEDDDAKMTELSGKTQVNEDMFESKKQLLYSVKNDLQRLERAAQRFNF
eukprot:TRINITY_DN2143_c0_g1_i1.p1 TRINITY_DN2143_c0_g1~~TRINITY_DN2143_c0_g1_i1.p1  ORF type:complete len:126 (+),score=55.83 TRINITY_DN2143_c0_g1_i1:318-695(+)